MLDHIAITISSEANLGFYRRLGFHEVRRVPRENDTVIFLSNGDETLEVFVDAARPLHPEGPEPYGLRHICFAVDDIEKIHAELADLNLGEIKQDWYGNKLFFLHDPDGMPIEIKFPCGE